MKRDGLLLNVWTIDGKVFVKTSPDGASVRIFCDVDLQYCAKVMQTNFDEIPSFSWLFEEISLETIFRRSPITTKA